MSDSLDDYRRKRDFGRTPEPEPAQPGPDDDARFVVHRHEARNLHYDLRLQSEGVLVSFAVPKGFSYALEDKRLAVRTEDHPLEYETFEGVIPAGEYGAGTMRIWDRGGYHLARGTDFQEEMKLGELKLILSGRRLRGEWHLVRTKRDPRYWLLFKSRDRYEGPKRDSVLGETLQRARVKAMPQKIVPMACAGQRAPFTDPAWVFELDFVGRRSLVRKEGESLRLVGMPTVPEALARDLGQLRAESAVLDGVLVALDPAGRPSLERLEEELSGDGKGLTLYLFDLLAYEEFDLRGLPLLERRAALRQLLPATPRHLAFVDPVPGSGETLAQVVRTVGLPGLVAKRAESSYRGGEREDWVRVPVEADGEALDLAQALERLRPAARARVTNPDKVYWPEDGITKGELVDYYAAVGEFLLPYLRDRPVHLLRYPDGIHGQSFYQRQIKEGTPDWVRRTDVAEPGEEPHIHHVCDDLRTLLWMANLGSIDLHPWHSRVGHLESPDWVLLDLDPKDAPFRDVVRIAKSLGRLLRGMGLRPLLKTSGKTGLHVYVSILEGYTYEQVRQFAEMVARVVVRELPGIATVERSLASRQGKVYVDFGQNGRGQTVVAPYVVRPVPGAGVSTPLEWDELEEELTPGKYTLRDVPLRLAQRGDLFRPLLHDRQDLLPAIEALGEML